MSCYGAHLYLSNAGSNLKTLQPVVVNYYILKRTKSLLTPSLGSTNQSSEEEKCYPDNIYPRPILVCDQTNYYEIVAFFPRCTLLRDAPPTRHNRHESTL